MCGIQSEVDPFGKYEISYVKLIFTSSLIAVKIISKKRNVAIFLKDHLSGIQAPEIHLLESVTWK